MKINNQDPTNPVFDYNSKIIDYGSSDQHRSVYAPLEAGSRYDRNINASLYEGSDYLSQNPRAAQEWYRSENQGWSGQLLNGFVSRAISIGPKLGQGLANVVGLIGSPFTDEGIQGAFDNTVSNWFASLDENLRQALPVYKSQKYAEGNFLSKALTTSFWFDDGFDGLAFLASALLPGTVFGKIGSVAGAIGKGGKLGSTIAKGLTDMGTKLGISQTAALTTLYNTAAEAGVEAYQTQKQIERELAQQRGYDSFELMSGKEQEEVKLIAAERAAQTFWWNTVALLGPNLMQSKLFFKGAGDAAEDIRRSVRYGGKTAADFVAKPTQYLAKFGQNFASEGLWEENIQSSIQNYESRKALGATSDDWLVGPMSNLVNNAWAFTKSVLSLGMMATQPHTSEDEAGAAILLGGMIGGNSALVSTYWDNKRKKAAAEREVGLWADFKKLNRASLNLSVDDNKSFMKTFGPKTVTEKDEQGNDVQNTYTSLINPETGKTEVDPVRLNAYLATTRGNVQAMEESTAASVAGDEVWKEFIDRESLFSHAVRMSGSGTLSREDYNDLVELDPVLNGKQAEELGITNLVRDNKALALKYYDLINESKKEVAKTTDLTTPEGRAFAPVKLRIASYLNWKIDTLTDLKAKARTQEGLAQITSEINSLIQQKKDFIDNEATLKEQFGREIFGVRQLANKIKETREKLANLKPEDNEAEIVEQLQIDLAQFEELQQIYGIEQMEYGSDLLSNVIGQDASVYSASFQPLQARLQTRDQSSLMTELFYQIGKTKLNEQKIIDTVQAGNVDKTIEALGEVRVATPATQSALKDLTTTLQNTRADLTKSFEEIKEAMSDPESISGTEIELPDGSIIDGDAFIDAAYDADQTAFNTMKAQMDSYLQEIGSRLQTVNTQLSEVDTIAQRQQTETDQYAKLKAAALAGPQELLKALTEYYANKKIQDARVFLQEGLQAMADNKMFLNDSQTRLHIATLNNLKKYYQKRDDITQDVKDAIIPQIDQTIKDLIELLAYIETWKQTRIEIQHHSIANQSNLFEQLTGVSEQMLEPDYKPTNGLSAAIAFVMNSNEENKNKFREFLTQLATADPVGKYKAYQGLIFYVKDKLSAKEIETIKTGLQDGLWNNFLSEFEGKVDEIEQWKKDKGRILPQLLNPAKSLNKFLRRMSKPITDAEYPKVFETGDSSLAKLTWERDINKLFVLLRTEHSFDPATNRYTLNGESQAVNDQFNEALHFLNFASGVGSVLELLDSKLNWASYHVQFAKMYEETVTNAAAGTITPSAQQLIVIDQLITTLVSDLPKPVDGIAGSWIQSFEAFSVMSGLLGTGKTAVVASNVVKLLKALTGISSDAIIGTARTQIAAEGVGKSIGSKSMPLADLVKLTNLTGIKYIVLDEAFQISEEELKQLWTVVHEHNKVAETRDRIHVLALGDPSQVRNGKPEFFPLSSISTTSTHDTMALAAIYRTGFTSISNAALAFHLNNKRVTALSTTANVSLQDVRAANSTDNFFGVVAGSDTFKNEQAIISLLSKQSSKKRLVIVNNQLEADKLLAALPDSIKAAGNVEIRSYDNAQSMTVDQAYIMIDPNKLDAYGNQFDAMAYNTAMYTSIGRAREFVFLATPDFQVSHMTNEALSKEKENIDLDVEVNRDLFKSMIESSNIAASTLFGGVVANLTPSPATKERQKEAEYDEPADDIIDHDDTAHDKLDELNSEYAGTPEQTLRKTFSVKKNGEQSEVEHSLRYPSASRIANIIKNNEIIGSGPIKIVAAVANNKYGVEFKVIGQKTNGKWVVLGVLGQQDIADPLTGTIIQQIFNENKDSSKWLPATVNMNNSDTGFDLTARMEAAQIAGVSDAVVTQLTTVKFLYDYTAESPDDAITDSLLKFHDAYFSSQGFTPLAPWFDEGFNPIWSNIAKVAKVAIYSLGTSSTKEDVNTIDWVESNQVSPNFVPRPGVPYLVITDPRSTNSATAKPTHIYIRLQPKKLSTESPLYKTLQTVDGILEKVERTTGIAYGTEAFDDMVIDLKQNFEVAFQGAIPSIKLKAGIELTEKVQPYLKDAGGTDVLATAIVELVNMFYAPIKDTYSAPKDEAEQMLEKLKTELGEEGDNLKIQQLGESKYYRIVDITDNTPHKEWKVSLTSSPFQRAINSIAKANKSVDGINIRVSRLMPTGAARRGGGQSMTTFRTGKSILAKEVSMGEFYKPWLNYLVNEFVPMMRAELEAIGMFNETTWIDNLQKMTRNSTDSSRLHKTEIIETRIQRYLNNIATAVEKNPEAAKAIADLIQELNEIKEETRKQMLTQFATAPLNRGTLQSMLNTNEKGETSLYTPLLRHNITAATANDVDSMGINDLGSNLANPEHRNQLGNVLTTKFQGVILPNIAIKFKHTPTKDLTPEQPVTNSNAAKALDAKKADIKRRRGLNGVEEIVFSNPNFRLEGFEIDGNYWNVVTSTERAKVLVNINGVIVPFYLTTGQAGKGLVPGWYPFFGIGKDGWLNKTDKSDMETYYERYWGKETADIVKSISEELNSFYGTDPSTFKNDGDPNATSRPLTTLADKVEDYINSKLNYTPAINDANARKTLRSNVEQLGREINAKYDAELKAVESLLSKEQTPVTRQDVVEFFSDDTNWEKRSVDDLIAAAQTLAVGGKGRKILQIKLIEKLAAKPVGYETLTASGQKDWASSFGNKQTAAYIPELNTIRSAATTSTEILLHELAHHFTASAVVDPKTDADFIFKDRLRELWVKYTEYFNGTPLKQLLPNTVWKENPTEEEILKEFVAHMFNSGQFRGNMLQVKLGKSNLFDKFIDAIKKLLGLTSEVNLYEALQWTLDTFLDEVNSDVTVEAHEDLDFSTSDVGAAAHSPLQLSIAKLAGVPKLNPLSDEVYDFATELLQDTGSNTMLYRAIANLAPLMISYDQSNSMPVFSKLLKSFDELKVTLNLEQDLGQNLSNTNFIVKHIVGAFFAEGISPAERMALAVIEKRVSASPTTSGLDTEKLISKILLQYMRNPSGENELKETFKFLNEQKNAPLLNFVKRIYTTWQAATNEEGVAIGEDKFSFTEAIKPTLKQHQLIVKEGFTDKETGNTIKGFASVASYSFVRAFIIDALAGLHNKNLRDDNISDELITTSEENRSIARQMVNARIFELENNMIPAAAMDVKIAEKLVEENKKNADDTSMLERFKAKHARYKMQLRALYQLDNKIDNRTLFDEVIEGIYGTWEIKSTDTELEIDLYDEEDGVQAEGIRKEMMDNDAENMELKLTSSVKEYLNFIPNTSSATLSNKYYSAKKAFVTLAQVFIDYLDLGSMLSADNPIAEWNNTYAELADSNKSPLSGDEIDFVRELDVLVRNSLETSYAVRENGGVVNKKFPSNVRMFILSENPGDTKIVFVVDQRVNPTIPLDKMSPEDVQDEPLIKILAVRNSMKTLHEAMRTNKVFAEYSDVYLMNALYRREKSRRVLTEMTNVFASMTEKSYMLGKFKNTANGFHTVNYIEAKGSGLTHSIVSSIRQAIVSYAEVFAPAEGSNGLSGLLDKTINKINPRTDIIERLNSARIEDRKLGFSNFLTMFGLQNVVAFQTIKNNIEAAVFKNIEELLKDLSSMPITDDIDSVIERLNENNRGRIQSISKVIKTSAELDRTTSITDGRGNKIYRLVPASFFYDSAYQFIRVGYNRRTEDRLSGSSKIGVASLDKYVPRYFFETEYFQQNIFVNSELQTIYSVSEHDSLRNEYSSRAITFGKETPKEWHTRTFSMGFLDSLSGSSNHRYQHFLFQPSDNPRIPAVEIKMLNSAELTTAAAMAIKQLLGRSAEYLKTVNGRYEPEEYRMFTLVKDYMTPGKTDYTDAEIDMIAGKVVERLFTGAEVEKYIQDFLNAETIVPANVPLIYENLFKGDKNKFNGDPYLKVANENRSAKKYENVGLLTTSREYERDDVEKAYDPLLRLAFANYYINGYHLNQLFTGQYDQYKTVEDVVKRMAGVLAPGIKPLIAPWAANKTYNLGIIEDTEVGFDENKGIPQRMLDFVKKFHNNTIDDARAAELLKFFTAFKTTDAQGFISKKRMRELRNAYGPSYKLGSVFKPVYFGTHIHETLVSESLTKVEPTKFTTVKEVLNAEGNVVYQVYRKDPRSVYVKYSAVHMDSTLLAKYPELQVFDKYMDDNDIDEMVFPSAVKIGGVNSNMFTIEDAATLREMYKHLQGDQPLIMGDKNMRRIPLENRFYRMQFNPVAKFGENKVTAPSQLPYFTNILGQTTQQADIALQAHATIVSRQLDKIITKITGDKNAVLTKLDTGVGVDRETANTMRRRLETSVRNAVVGGMGSPGSKALQAMLKAGLSMSNPALFDKVFTQIMASISTKGLSIKFPGGKLVLQSDEGFVNPQTGKPLEYNTENGLPYAEVILPQGMLSDEMQAALDRGETLYLTPDFLGFRIPTTEVHSAIPMRVVGTYDSKGTNVIVAPYTLVYLHGSDFDVDSLFVIARSTLSKTSADFLGIPADVPIGYIWDENTKKYIFGDKFFNTSNLKFEDQMTNESIEEYYMRLLQEKENLIRQKISELEAEKDQLSSTALTILSNELREVQRVEDDLMITLNKNRMFEAYVSVLQSPATASRMMTPILMTYFNDMALPESVASRLSKLDSRLWESDSFKDLNNLNTSIDAFVTMQSGVRLTGVFANVVKVLAYLQRTSSATNLRLKSDKAFRYKINETEHSIDKLSDYDLSDGSILTWTYLDALINLAIDNLKELTLGKLNITINNANIYSALIALGLPPYDVSLMFKSELAIATKNVSRFYKGKTEGQLFARYLKEAGVTLTEDQTATKYIESLYDAHVLSTADAEKLAKKALDKTPMIKADLPIIAALHKILSKGDAIGNNVMYTSWAMGPIRGIPTKELSVINLEKNLKEVFKAPSYSALTSKEPIKNGWEVRDSYAFEVDDMFKTLPHFKQALVGFYRARKVADFATSVTANTFTEAVNKMDPGRYLTPFAKRNFDALVYRDEFLNYLYSSMSYSYLHNLKGFQDVNRRRSSASRYMVSLADQLYALIKQVKSVEGNKAQLLGNEYIPNRFLSNLTEDRIAGNKPSFRMANLDPADEISRRDGEDGFINLGKYKITERMSGDVVIGYDVVEDENWVRPFKVGYDNLNLLQKHLLVYAMASKDIRQTKTSYVFYLPPHLIKENYDKPFYGLILGIERQLARGNSALLNSIDDDFLLSFSAKYIELVDNIGSYTFKVNKAAGKEGNARYINPVPASKTMVAGKEQNKYNGSEEVFGKTIHFDKKYENTHYNPASVNLSASELADSVQVASINPENEKKDPAYQDFPLIGVVQEPKYTMEGDYIGRTPVLYIRLNDPTVSKFVYYRKIGKPVMENYFSRIAFNSKKNSYSLRKAFDPTIKEVLVKDSKIDVVETRDTLEIGQVIQMTSYDDFKRYYSRIVKIVKPKPVSSRDGVNTYEVIAVADERNDANSSDYDVSQILSSVAEPTKEKPELDMLFTIDAELESATTNIDSEFERIVNIGMQWEVPTTDTNVYQSNGIVVDRVTSNKSGILNQMRAKQWREDWSWGKVKSDQMWRNTEPDTVLDTEFGRVNKETYAEKIDERGEKNRLRGSIIHAILQKHATTDPAKVAEIQAKIDAWMLEAGYESNWFDWLNKPKNYERVFKKAGLNIYDEGVPNDLKDKAQLEVTVTDTRYLKMGGTIDMLIKKANGRYAIRDFTFGSNFHNSSEAPPFKYGIAPNMTIWANPKNSKKLQMMWYAFMMRLENPEIRFEDLEVIYLPNKDNITTYDSSSKVEVSEFLYMIREYLKNEKPEVLKKIEQDFNVRFGDRGKEYFGSLFNSAMYDSSNQTEARAILEDKELRAQLDDKLQQLRTYMLFDFQMEQPTGPAWILSQKAAKAQENKAEAVKVFKEVMTLLNDDKLNIRNARDISFLSMWLASNANQNSPFIQAYDKFLKERKLRANERIEKTQSTLKALITPVIADYERVHGKDPFGGIPLLKGKLNFYDTRKMWDWMYTEVQNPDGTITEKIRTTDAEWAAIQSDPAYASYGNWEARKRLAKFMTDTYKSFFENANGITALANRVATVQLDTSGNEIQWKPISNLALHNYYRKTERESSPFAYYDGWFPKVQKLMEEFKGPLHAEYWDQIKKRYLTLEEDHEYEDVFNNVEALPMKYLGTQSIELSKNYSRSAEWQFMKFVRNSILKEELDDVFAFGRGVMEYLQQEQKVDKNTSYNNTINYLRTAIDMQVRNISQRSFPGGFVQRNEGFTRSEYGHLYKLDFLKMIQSFKNLAAGPVMWFKPIQGSANAVFAYMVTLKEGLKNSIIKAVNDKFLGVDGDQLSFTLSDIMWATKEWKNVQAAAMKGELPKNKTFLLAKYLGYMPNNYAWYSEKDSLSSLRNKVFDSSTLYMFHSMGEEAVALITMLAQLRSMKVKSTGKSIWDHYVVENETVDGVAVPTVKWDGTQRGLMRKADGTIEELKELTTNEIRRMFYVYESMHGGYRPDEKTKMEYYIFGQLLMQFKRYIPAILKNVWRSQGEVQSWGYYKFKGDMQDGKQVVEWHARVMEGRWKVLGKLLMASILPKYWGSDNQTAPNAFNRTLSFLGLKKFAAENYTWSNLNEYQQEVVLDAVLTLFMFVALAAGGAVAFNDFDDDDPFVKWLRRIQGNMFQQWNPYELGKDLLASNGMTNAGRQAWGLMSGIYDMTIAGLMYPINPEASVTQDGTWRGLNNVMKHTPVVASAYDIYKAANKSEDQESFWNRIIIRP